MTPTAAPDDSNSLSKWAVVSTALASGAVAGSLAKTTIAPLDRTKIIFQTSSTRFTYRAAFRTQVNIYKNEGFSRLWRGNTATLVRVVPYSALQYASHEQYKSWLLEYNGMRRDSRHLPSIHRFLAGSLAGVTASFFTYPLDTARARMAVTTSTRYKHIGHVFTECKNFNNFKLLFRGYIPTLLGQLPYGGTAFYTYETCQLEYSRLRGTEPGLLWRLVFGALAGFAGQSISYPLDVVRRRMQTGGLTELVSHRGTIATARHIYRTEGFIRGMFKGLSMNWIKGPIAAGVSFTTNDAVRGLLRSFASTYNTPS